MKKQILILLAILLIAGNCKAQSSPNNLFGNTINYSTGTVIITSINAALTAFNLSGISPAWETRYTQGAALVTGAFQIVYGVYQSRSNLGSLNYVNIAAGSATLITNAILFYNSLYSKGNKTTVKKKTAWNIFYSPLNKNNPEFGLRVVRYINI